MISRGRERDDDIKGRERDDDITMMISLERER